MKASARAVVGVLLLGEASAASMNGVIQWDIQKNQRSRELRRLGRRASTFEEVITNEQARGGYFATCRLGTPGQNLTLQLDTGSSDIWLPDSNAQICTRAGRRRCDLGTFDPSRSSTYQVTGKGAFNINYVDGSSSKGDYFTDVFEIGGATLRNMTMGLGLETDIPYGLVGVGYAASEAIVGQTQSTSSAYPNLPVNMAQEGLISTVAYSLWLNDLGKAYVYDPERAVHPVDGILDSSSGNILFGGIDTAKYQGQLTRIDIYPSQPDLFTSFRVALTSLQAISPSGSDTLTSEEFPFPVVLDSGTTLSYLPTDLAQHVWNEVGAVYSPEFKLAVIPCRMQNSKGYFSFGFAGPSGPRINVTMDELVLDLTSGQPPVFNTGPYKGQEACEFGIQNFSTSPYLLGDSFLRSAYVVYDLVNNQIGIAPTDFNATESNIVAFPSFGAQIPSATVAPDQSQATATSSPAGTTSSYAASPGFTDTAGTGSGDSSSTSSMPAAIGRTQTLLLAISMLMSILGSGLLLAI
jgi:elongation factor G